MKLNSKHRNICTMGVALLLTLSLTQCSLMKKNCCGYKGPIVAPQAISLYGIDHFIPKDTIDDWTARYDANNALLKKNNFKGSELLVNSCSFNGYYVRLLLCNKNCIGLRVLHGMDTKLKVHIILVGIKPDYSTLYIPKPGVYFSEPKAVKAILGVNSTDWGEPALYEHVVGGLQFSQKP